MPPPRLPNSEPSKAGRTRQGVSVHATSGDELEADPFVFARRICLQSLERRARSRVELADTLRKKQVPADIAEQVLDRLTEVGLIDDAAYAERLVESQRRQRGLARRALMSELRRHGIAAELAHDAVGGISTESEEDVARSWAQRRLRAVAHLDASVRVRRLVGMLARKGYPPELAYRVVRELVSDASEVHER